MGGAWGLGCIALIADLSQNNIISLYDSTVITLASVVNKC